MEQHTNYEGGKTQREQVKLVNQVIEQIKDRHFADWMRPIKKELLDEVAKVKVELQCLRAEWNMDKGLHASELREVKCEVGKLRDAKVLSGNPANSKIKKDHDWH